MATIKIKNPNYVEGESNKWIPVSTLIKSDADDIITKDGDGSKYLSDDGTYKEVSLEGYATEEWVENKGYLTEYTDTVYDDTEVKQRLDSLESVTSTAVQPDAIVDMETKTNASATYATKNELNTHATEAREYTDTVITNLVNAAPDTLDTLGELAQAILDNEDVVELLEQSISSKQDKIEDIDSIRSSLNAKVNSDGNVLNIVKTTTLPDSPNANTLYIIVAA